MRKKYLPWIILLILTLIFVPGCGRKKTPTSSPTLKTIEILPDTDRIVVLPGKTLKFSPKGFDQNGKEMTGITFTWSVEPASAGTISKDGLFEAADTEGNCQIVCQAKGVVKRVNVTVEDREPEEIKVTPTHATVLVGKTKQFTAEGFDQDGNMIAGLIFSWSVVPPTAGTFDENGLFTAGDTPGNYEVICQTGALTKSIPVAICEGELQMAGEQLVADSQAAWANFLGSPRLSTILNTQALPATQIINDSIDNVFSFVMNYDIFYYKPGNYENYAAIFEAEEFDDMQVGTWTYKDDYYEYDEEIDEDSLSGQWTVQITRKTDGTLNYLLELDYVESDDVDRYEGYIITTDVIPADEETPDFNFDFGIEFDLANSAKGSLGGTANVNVTIVYEEDYSVLNYGVARIEGAFTYNNGQYDLDGELNLSFDSAKADTFHGTINFPDASFVGGISLTYVSNPWLEGRFLLPEVNCEMIPNKLTLEGSFTDKNEASALAITGALTLELKNAATWNFQAPYSDENWPGFKLSFDGELVSEDNDCLAGAFSLEQKAWNQLSVAIGYVLTSDGIIRQINLVGESIDESRMGITLTSDWGEAVINMELRFTPELFYFDAADESYRLGELSKLSGQVTVQGEKVGDISLSDKGVRVDYKDGTFETF